VSTRAERPLRSIQPNASPTERDRALQRTKNRTHWCRIGTYDRQRLRQEFVLADGHSIERKILEHERAGREQCVMHGQRLAGPHIDTWRIDTPQNDS